MQFAKYGDAERARMAPRFMLCDIFPDAAFHQTAESHHRLIVAGNGGIPSVLVSVQPLGCGAWPDG
jgi:hypothetical protein